MKGRMLASVVMTAIGASLLAAAMFASTAAGAGAAATAKKGGTITIVNRSDFDTSIRVSPTSPTRGT